MNVTERALQPSHAQILLLLDMLEKNPSLAKGFLKIPSARESARRSWEKISAQLNSMGGCIKSAKQWMKYWADKKSAVKKKVVMKNKIRTQTGGGAAVVPVELNVHEERVLGLMGGEGFARGDSHLAVNPFIENSESVSTNSESPSLLAVPPAPPLAPEPGPSQIPPIYGYPYIEGISRIEVECEVRRMETSPARVATAVGPSTPSSVGRHPLEPAGPTPARRRLLHNYVLSPHREAATVPSRGRRRQRARTHTPPSQRRSLLSTLSDRFLAVEERHLELQSRNADIIESFMRRDEQRQMENLERDRALTAGLQAMADGLQAMAEALTRLN